MDGFLRPLSKRKAFRVTELLSRARQYDDEAKEAGRKQSAVQKLQAEERQMALENELMSRRQFMDQQAIEQAEKEIKEFQPTIARMEAAKQALKEQYYKEPGQNTLFPTHHSNLHLQHSLSHNP